jgi:predicted kinase
MAGTTGSGKTTVATLLEHRLAPLRHLESDAVRKGLAGLAPGTRAGTDDLHGGVYTPAMTDATYAEMYRLAGECLGKGTGVVLDGTFRQRRRRALARAVGRDAGVAVAIVECRLDRERQLARLVRRERAGAATSDGRPAVLALHERDWEAVTDDEADLVVRVATGVPPAVLARRIAGSGGAGSLIGALRGRCGTAAPA